MGKNSAGRMINQDIALSSRIASLSPEALALFCLLIPHFNSHGKMLANPHAIKGTVSPLIGWLTVEMIGSCLAEISEKTNVKWWQDEKGLYYLHSLNWKQHQNLREDRLGPDHLPDFPGENETTHGLLPECSGIGPAKGKGREVKEEGKRSIPAVEKYPDDFESFWAAYPRKTQKAEALKAWRVIKPDGALLQRILAALEWQVKQPDWTKDGGRYVPYPSTWLRAAQWEDEPPTVSKPRAPEVVY